MAHLLRRRCPGLAKYSSSCLPPVPAVVVVSSPTTNSLTRIQRWRYRKPPPAGPAALARTTPQSASASSRPSPTKTQDEATVYHGAMAHALARQATASSCSAEQGHPDEAPNEASFSARASRCFVGVSRVSVWRSQESLVPTWQEAPDGSAPRSLRGDDELIILAPLACPRIPPATATRACQPLTQPGWRG